MNYYFDTARYLMGGYNVKLITPEKSLLSRLVLDLFQEGI